MKTQFMSRELFRPGQSPKPRVTVKTRELVFRIGQRMVLMEVLKSGVMEINSGGKLRSCEKVNPAMHWEFWQSVNDFEQTLKLNPQFTLSQKEVIESRNWNLI
jgi:hypothetical protein